ncbi:hypothetical protein P5W99_35630 [Paraburkholderia sp. A3BS-1L]|uniref:hypothetical protein n=1 Tax=Paraburkholderia sp. A3BS-1L TaxID=3028375 RepID=UPI003DA9473E
MNHGYDIRRRHVLHSIVAAGAGYLTWGMSDIARAANAITLPFENGLRELTTAFPQKGEMLGSVAIAEAGMLGDLTE